MDDRSFLGRGWSFDVKPDRITGRICMCSGEDDIAQAVRLILNTKKGERAMRPDFGCKLYSFAFESFSQSVCSAMVQEVKNALIMHEPRIQDIQVINVTGTPSTVLMTERDN